MPHDLESTQEFSPVDDRTKISDFTPPTFVRLPDEVEPLPSAPPGYDILGTLGRGGMGVVYKARQLALNRIVALKMILGGGHANSEDVQRFMNEAEMIASLQHPNIVQIHDLGQFQGLPFFALEFCSGGSLASKLDGKPWKPEHAAQLIRVIAEAMHFAHEKGIIHRDLKPGNILLSADNRPLVTDFGIAKMVQSNHGMTASGAIVGTPSYMAPEQARGDRGAINATTDIYALGAMLYELATGRVPFIASTPMETMIQVLQDQPVPPSQLQPNLPRDLETICLKCLAKDGHRRYPNASELAMDLGRFLRGEPIQARPISSIERFWRWCRRNPVVASLVVLLVCLSTISGVVGTSLAILASRESAEATEARKVAEQRLLQAEWLLYSTRMSAAQREWEAGHAELALSYLEETRWDMRAWEHRFLFTMFTRNQAVLRGTVPFVRVEVWDDGDTIAALTSDNETMKWDVATGDPIKDDRVFPGVVSEELFLSAESSGKWKVVVEQNEIVLRDAGSGMEVRRMEGVVEDSSTLALSPDHRWVAAALDDQTVRVWNAHNGENRWTFGGYSHPIRDVAFSPDGYLLATVSDDGQLRLWNTRTGQEHNSYWGHGGPIAQLVFLPDGRRIATAGSDHTVRLWDIRTSQEELTFVGTPHNLRGMAISPTGDRVVVVGNDCGATVHDAQTGELQKHWQDIGAPVTWCPTGAIAGRVAGGVRIWKENDSTFKPMLLTFPQQKLHTLRFSPKCDLLAGGFDDGSIIVWDTETGKELHAWKAHREGVTSILFHPTQPWLVTTSHDNTVKGWNLTTEEARYTLSGHTDDVLTAAMFPDGATFVTGSSDQTVKVWDFETGEQQRTLRGHRGSVETVLVDHEGTRIFSGGVDGNLKVWEVSSGTEVLSARIQRGGVCAIAIHPENQLIFAAGVNGRVEQLDGSLKPEWLLLSGHAHRVVCIGVSSDNRWVVSGSERGGVKLWNLTTGHEAWTVRDRIIELKAVGFSADNQRVITQDVEGRLAEWDVKTGKPVTRFKDPAPEPFLAIRTADDKLQVVADGNTLRLRHDPGHHPESKWICARLREWAPFDEAWHRKQAYHFAKEFAWFPAAFHQELLVKHHPDRPVLRIQLGVLRGLRDNWSEAWVEFLAAYRMWAYRK